MPYHIVLSAPDALTTDAALAAVTMHIDSVATAAALAVAAAASNLTSTADVAALFDTDQLTDGPYFQGPRMLPHSIKLTD